MALRRPSVYRENHWIVQDFHYFDGEPEELRFILVKYDGEPYQTVTQTFDSNSPEFWGGDIRARLDYSILDKLVTIDHWEVNWRDEWPLRLAINYLANCLYPSKLGYIIRVNKDAYPFWVSEHFFPASNDPDDYLLKDYGNS